MFSFYEWLEGREDYAATGQPHYSKLGRGSHRPEEGRPVTGFSGEKLSYDYSLLTPEEMDELERLNALSSLEKSLSDESRRLRLMKKARIDPDTLRSKEIDALREKEAARRAQEDNESALIKKIYDLSAYKRKPFIKDPDRAKKYAKIMDKKIKDLLSQAGQ